MLELFPVSDATAIPLMDKFADIVVATSVLVPLSDIIKLLKVTTATVCGMVGLKWFQAQINNIENIAFEALVDLISYEIRFIYFKLSFFYFQYF